MDVSEVSREYQELRAVARGHLSTAARKWASSELAGGRIRPSAYDLWVKYYSDIDAVDFLLEHARVYAEHCAKPLCAFNVETLKSTPGLADYVKLTWARTETENAQAAAFLDAVADRFELVRDDHAAQLGQRAANIARHLDACAAEMAPKAVESWARYGQALDEDAQKHATRGAA